jgi:hypothetical protein
MRLHINKPQLKLISFLFIPLLYVQLAKAIDWDGDIIPTAEEIENAKKDALSTYFGKSIDDGKLFRSFEYMDKLVGKYKDVTIEQYVFLYTLYQLIHSSQRNHNYTAMTEWLQSYANDYPNLTHLSSIGRSVEGRELWVMIVARNPKV